MGQENNNKQQALCVDDEEHMQEKKGEGETGACDHTHAREKNTHTK